MSGYIFASAAALCFGVASAVQHRAAHAIPVAGVGPVRLVARLIRDRRWLAGRVLDTVAVVLQALALRSGSLVVVQCIVACGIVAAIGTSAAMNRRTPHRRELLGSSIVVLGVVMVSGLTKATHAHGDPSSVQWAQIGVLALGIAAFGWLALHPTVRWSTPVRQSLLLGVLAGACFALGSGFLKLASLALRHPGQRQIAVIAIVAFAMLGFVGNVAAQRSFQIGEISHGLPAIVATEPIVALVAGSIMFHERVAHAQRGAVGVVGLVVVIVGVIVATEMRSVDR